MNLLLPGMIKCWEIRRAKALTEGESCASVEQDAAAYADKDNEMKTTGRQQYVTPVIVRLAIFGYVLFKLM